MNLREKILSRIDFVILLKEFSERDLAIFFSISINEVKRIRFTQIEKKRKDRATENLTTEPEIKLGKKGAWMDSDERKVIKALK